MLPRLLLLALLVFVAAADPQQPTPVAGAPGLFNRLAAALGRRAGASASDSGDSPCKGTRCARLDSPAPPPETPRSDVAVSEPEDDDEDDAEDDGADVEEGRGKKGKKKKGYGKYIVMAGFTKAVLLYLMIHAVAMLAGKALVIAKVALAIATALALKKSSVAEEIKRNENASDRFMKDHKTSYEIVKHPQYSSVHTHSQSVDYDHGGGGYEGGSRRRRTARR